MRLVVVTGLSGSGKTLALKALEDLGFFCIDNLPVELLPKLLQLGVFSGGVVNKLAVGMDSRDQSFFDGYRAAFEEVERLGIRTEVVFLDAGDETLLRRFSETRRVHPLTKGRPVSEGIREERERFRSIREGASLVLDTSKMSVHDLKRTLWGHFRQGSGEAPLQVTLVSFGFRNGPPYEADLVLDVRFLPNPYFTAELKDRTGTDPEVRDFVFRAEEGRAAVDKYADLLLALLPLYEAEGKSYLTVAVGCTGGRHRSVAVVERLAADLARAGREVRVVHRDMGKTSGKAA